jgi:hypothetical protein
MAAKKGSSNSLTASTKKSKPKPKTTSIGHSKNTRFRSKNDKRIKKHYRGQGK